MLVLELEAVLAAFQIVRMRKSLSQIYQICRSARNVASHRSASHGLYFIPHDDIISHSAKMNNLLVQHGGFDDDNGDDIDLNNFLTVIMMNTFS
jgi:hypothetical protein